eukprot:5979101-Pleurochrysis_carterae.AAC.1
MLPMLWPGWAVCCCPIAELIALAMFAMRSGFCLAMSVTFGSTDLNRLDERWNMKPEPSTMKSSVISGLISAPAPPYFSPSCAKTSSYDSMSSNNDSDQPAMSRSEDPCTADPPF